MNPVTLRRLLVFGVCAVGVGALYLAPSIAAGPGQVSAPRPEDEPTGRATAIAIPTAADRNPDRGGASTRPDAGPATTTTNRARPVELPSRRPPARPEATPYDPAASPDRSAPQPVSQISTATVTADRVTLRWPPATDDVAVVSYRVWLDGFSVATTRETEATVRWFNNDRRAHVVQVRALDAAGNQSLSSPNLLVARPTPEPSPEPSEEPSVSTPPSAEPSAGPLPSGSPGSEPSAAVPSAGGGEQAPAVVAGPTPAPSASNG